MKKFVVFLVIFVFILFLFFSRKDTYELLNNIESDYVSVDKYFIYGNHLNIEGSIDITDFDDIKLAFKNLKNELEFDVNYTDGKFSTSDLINDGIYLDNIPIYDYLVFLKVTYGDDIKYYSLVNNTNYDDISYFTVTKNNSNNLINISFSSRKNKNYMMVSVSKTTVSDNYYDVIIDAGHGGEDPGATFSKYTEAELNLKMALELKEALESIGLKVGLTRDDDTYIEAYGTDSRTALAYESGAKYFISLHLNSFEGKMNYGGVEIYAPNHSNLDFASSLASNIVDYADTSYSKKETFKASRGVYIRTFTTSEINSSVDEAKKYGYSPYSITTDTNYYFMIRETGGFMTSAYVDGRNKNSNKNDYYDSNVGVESYLLELGYINYWGDLNNLVDNTSGYINGIVNAFQEELKI